MDVILSCLPFHSIALILFQLVHIVFSRSFWENQSNSFLIPFSAKQDIQLRLHTLSPPRSLPSYPLHLQSPLPLPQLSTLLTLLNQSLDIIDISTWTGDPHNGSFIAGQLHLLADTIDEARQVLKGGEEINGGRWWEEPADETVRFEFRPLCKDFLYFPIRPAQGPYSLTSTISLFHPLSNQKLNSDLRLAILAPPLPLSLRASLHCRCRPRSSPAHPHLHNPRPFFLLLHLLFHRFFPDRVLAAPPSRPTAETAPPRRDPSGVWMARGGGLCAGKGSGRKSGSEFDFHHGQVERAGAWCCGVETGFGCGDGRRGRWRAGGRVTEMIWI